MNDLSGLINQTNGRLKAAKVGVVTGLRGDRLYLRATLPPKPHVAKDKPYQQKIYLGVRATPAGVQYAEQQARLIGAELNLNRFDWSKWLGQSDQIETTSDWIIRFEEDYWNRHKRTKSSENTWKVYAQVFKKLPNEVLTLELLLDCVKSTTPDSRSRQKTCMVLAQLAKLAKLPTDTIQVLSGDYSPNSVSPRSLPIDKAIIKWRNRIQNRGWCWVYGMIATYGLRPHEVFHLDLKDFPTVRVESETKTEARFIYPLYPEWPELWSLEEQILPGLKVIAEGDNTKLGGKVSKFFYESSIPFTAYDLRHSYSRRCFEFGFSPDLGAKLMGHSVPTHTKIYRAWIDEAVYRRAYEALISRSDRPLPPT